MRESATLVPSEFNALMDTVAGSLQQPGDLAETLARITHSARDMVPRADYASISVRHADGVLETIAPTDALISTVDEIQQLLGEGPSYRPPVGEQVTYSGNLSLDERWPSYGQQVSRLGLASQLGMTLHTDPGARTGLNLYSRKRAAFGDSRQVAGIFASHAKVALGHATEVNTLQSAMATHTVMGQAIEIVMERHDLDEERALELLIRVSRRSNVLLRVVAGQIVETAVNEGQVSSR